MIFINFQNDICEVPPPQKRQILIDLPFSIYFSLWPLINFIEFDKKWFF